MNSTQALRKTQNISTSYQIAGQNSVKNNLSNRFSAEHLKTISIAQKPETTKPSTYGRNMQIAKIAVAVIGLTVTIFAAYSYLSRPPISCSFFQDNDFTGTGVRCMFEDGSMYQGRLEKGYISGEGSYTNLSGQKFTGIFNNALFSHDGLSIELSELDECTPEGLTACVIALRNKDCNTIHPDYSGEVDCTFDDGSRYQGSVINDDKFSGIFSGNGTYTNPSGQIFPGTFDDDELSHDGLSITLSELDKCTQEGLTNCVIALRKEQT